MSWKLKTLKVENFKFFHAPFTLDVESKNLLIYGENGSGKSSIYWALYTLFQSPLKQTADSVRKYFDPTSNENLRNKYSVPGDDSKVEVFFEDITNPTSSIIHYTISKGLIDTQNPSDFFLAFTIKASDFLNYKILSKLTDKDNSVINDVTDLFEKEVFPFADFDKDYEELNGRRSNKYRAKLWLDYIYEALGQLRHQRGKRHAHFDKNDPNYKRFNILIKDFHDQLENYLNEISIRATEKLNKDFKVKDVSIHFETDPVFQFDLPVPTSPQNRDHTLHPLHIRMKAQLNNAQLPGGQADIIHLRTFFNEAKLTCIGLAVRLAMVDKKYLSGGNFASILCLDDMLVSLDMSYRVPVTEALLEYSNKYQLCIFTHDRSLYNMMQGEINDLGYNRNDWKFYEFYRPDPSTETTEEPKVNCINPKEGLDKVKGYIAQGDYPAAGNYLRKYAENLIKSILPLNLTYMAKNEGKIERLMLRDLYIKTIANRNEEDFCRLYDIAPTIMPNISNHLKRLMNPLSHDDKDVPIFRFELESAMAEVSKYEPISAGKKVLVKRDEAGVKSFRMEMNHAGVTESVDFVTTEQWDYITFPAPIGKKYKNCEVKIVASPSGNYLVDSKVRVKNLYADMQYKVYSSHTGALPFDQTIKEISTGTLLNAL